MKLNTFFKKFLAAISLLAVTLTGANAGVTNIIPFGPGGESDVTARMQQPYYKEIYKRIKSIYFKSHDKTHLKKMGFFSLIFSEYILQ